MQVKCHHCDAVVPAENINIQEMVALCPACSHVFPLDKNALNRKFKARKLKRPTQINQRELDDGLELSYRRVYGAGARFGWIIVTLIALFYTVLALGARADGASRGPVVLIGALAALCWYVSAVFATKNTRITATEDNLAVRSGPLPFSIKDDKTIRMGDIDQVLVEKSSQAMLPLFSSHQVVAEMRSGIRLNVVTGLPQEHAWYLAHTLDAYLHDASDMLIYESDDAMSADEGDQLADGELDLAASLSNDNHRFREMS